MKTKKPTKKPTPKPAQKAKSKRLIYVLEHDSDGNIHGVALFPNSQKGVDRAMDYGFQLIREIFARVGKDDESDETPEEAMDELWKNAEWKGFSTGVSTGFAPLIES